MKKFIDISNVNINKELPKIDFNLDDGAYELACSIFDVCNLRCSFCFQEHNSIKSISIKDMKKIPKVLFDFMDKEIPKYNINIINLKFWGGELFFDAIPDYFFDIYLEIFEKFKEKINIKYPYIKIYVTWLTNGVFTKYKRVEYLLEKTNGIIGFSYDPIGRFTNPQLYNIFKKTVNHFIELNNFQLMASITLSKSAIDYYINSKQFETFIDSVRMKTDISYYTPGISYSKDTPDDNDIFNFFKWAIDRKMVNIRAVYDIITMSIGKEIPYLHYCNCAKAAQYSNGVITKNCALRTSAVPEEDFYGKYTSEVNEDNCAEYKNSLGIIKRGCLTCEYYTNCQKFCWLSLIYKGYKVSECPLKRACSYFLQNKDKNSILSVYKTYTGFWEE